MASLVARAVLCLIFGFFIYETINEFNKLSGLSLNPHFAIVPAVLIYTVQELAIKKLRTNEKTARRNKPVEPRIDKVFYFIIAWILVAIFFLAILVVWAGAIYKQVITKL
jgi:hypothetical protein